MFSLAVGSVSETDIRKTPAGQRWKGAFPEQIPFGICSKNKIRFINTENLGNLPAFKKLKAWYNNNFRCIHPWNVMALEIQTWGGKCFPAFETWVPRYSHHPTLMPHISLIPTSWFARGWWAKLINFSYISAQGNKTCIFPAEVNIDFSSRYFQCLVPLEVLLPRDIRVHSHIHTLWPGERGGYEIVPAGENTSELAKKSPLPWKNKPTQSQVGRH